MKRFCVLILTLLTSGWLRSAEAAPAKSVQFTYAGPYVCDADHLVQMENFPVPAGVYGKLVLDMDITTGPWNPVNPRGWHDLFWMVQSNRNLNMLGFAALRKEGNKSPEAMLRQGIGVQHVKKTKDIKEVAITPNTAYHINYVFDMTGGHAALLISHEGSEVTKIETVPLFEPPARAMTFVAGDTLTIGLSTAMGFGKEGAPEAPSLGWTYRNLHVSMDRAAEKPAP